MELTRPSGMGLMDMSTGETDENRRQGRKKRKAKPEQWRGDMKHEEYKMYHATFHSVLVNSDRERRSRAYHKELQLCTNRSRAPRRTQFARPSLYGLSWNTLHSIITQNPIVDFHQDHRFGVPKPIFCAYGRHHPTKISRVAHINNRILEILT
jgi:hypothetical protein